ncbi:IclR family transcriptional regulator [Paenarthrobacter nitroguajacolicus]
MTAGKVEQVEDMSAEDAGVSNGGPDLTNKSVIKAMALLTELGRHKGGLTSTELAQAVRITRPTAFRMLLTLEQTGFVDRSENLYTLGWQVARLGRHADPYAGVVARIQPILDEYAAKLNETFSFAMVRDETTYDVIAEASGFNLLNTTQPLVGREYPVHATASGKILLAELDDRRIDASLPEILEAYTADTITNRKALHREIKQVRQQGYAILDNELEEGLFAVACATRDSEGSLTGVLSVNGPLQRLKSTSLPATIEQLHQAAQEIGKALD